MWLIYTRNTRAKKIGDEYARHSRSIQAICSPFLKEACSTSSGQDPSFPVTCVTFFVVFMSPDNFSQQPKKTANDPELKSMIESYM